MATVTIKFQKQSQLVCLVPSTSYKCWLNPLKTQAILVILVVLVIKRVQRVLPKLHAKRAIIRTLTVTYGTLQKNKRSSMLNLPKQRQVCPSLFFQFNMRISVIYGTLSVSCKHLVSVLSLIKFLWRVPILLWLVQSRTEVSLLKFCSGFQFKATGVTSLKFCFEGNSVGSD